MEASPGVIPARSEALRIAKKQVLGNKPTFIPIEDDKLCDITVVCSDGSFRAEKSILARAGEPFLKMITTPMKESLSGQLQFPEFSIATVQIVYRTIREYLLKSSHGCDVELESGKSKPRPSEDFCRWIFPCQADIESISEVLRFAHMYTIDSTLYQMKILLLQHLPAQWIFDADKKFSLGLRPALMQNIRIHFVVNQRAIPLDGNPKDTKMEIVGFTEPEIYLELFDQIFKDRKPNSVGPSYNNFITSFVLSKLSPHIFGTERIRGLYENEATAIAENITDPTERWNFWTVVRCGSDNIMAITSTLRKRLSDKECTEKQKRARSEKE